VERASFQHRILEPVIVIFFLAALSYMGYFGSRSLENDTLRLYLATATGGVYFMCLSLGPLVIFTITTLKGASLAERILASLAIPFIWMTKDVILLTQSHPLLESLYWFFNPLYIWLTCLLVAEMGLGTLIARTIIKRRREAVKVVTPAPLLAIIFGMIIFSGLFAWGQGENIYAFYLEVYRLLFGSGV